MSLLAQVFAALRSEVPHALVLVGHLPLHLDGHAGADTAGRIVATGYVPNAHVAPLLSHADLLVFPSWYEGFGLPVLDAQALDVPVACSNAASLPEVAGDGAGFFDPYSIEDMIRAIRACLCTPGLRGGVGGQGVRQCRPVSLGADRSSDVGCVSGGGRQEGSMTGVGSSACR